MRLDDGHDARKIGVAGDERGRHLAIRRERGAVHEQDGCKNSHDYLHASPPARSASEDLTREPGLRPSIFLYHDIRYAVAIMIKMPIRLTPTCISGPPDHSLMMN